MAADPTLPGVGAGAAPGAPVPAPSAPVPAPRLLAGWRGAPVTLAGHRAVHGTLPAVHPAGVIDAVRRAGLIGRGGARFPAAVKLESVASQRGAKVVLANGAEGEPVSHKDRELATRVPHLVLDGAAVAAAAVGAARVIVAVRPTAAPVVAAAIEERRAHSVDQVTPEVLVTPDRFLAGEESALANLASGGPLLPRFVPPRPYERGVRGRPTLVSNVETLAHMALIARYGPEWFRQVGAAEEPGTTLVTLGGAVLRPGVHEVPRGLRLADALQLAGGPSAALQAVLVGGYSGTWVPVPAAWDAPLSEKGLAPLGGVLGAGVVMPLAAAACGVAETAAILRYLSDQSANQCGPCINGLDAIAAGMEQLAAGAGRRDTVERLRSWAWQVSGRGACHHPDGAVRLLSSSLEVFAADIAAHRQGRPCAHARRPPAARAARAGTGRR